MTCGIYILKFNGTDKVYVGQSENIEYRFKKHLQKLRNNSHNNKMQEAYAKYGEPYLEIILDDLTKDQLNDAEFEAFTLYNAIDNGFNIAREPNIHENGDKNPASRYSNEIIEQVFFQLLDINNRYVDIELNTGVSISTIRHISNSEAHLWLKSKYPIEYKKLESLHGLARMSNANSALSRGIKYPPILSPSGQIFEITNIAEFCREHSLDSSSLAKVLKARPKYNSHKGWRLAHTNQEKL